MKTYTVRKIYKYTELVWVTADNYGEALDLSNMIEGEYQNDDMLYDAEVIGVTEFEE